MELISDNKKKLLTIEDDKLIYHRLFKNIIINRSEIRSVFYDEDTLGVLTYSGKIYSLRIGKLLYSERIKLEKVRELLSKEDILFTYVNKNEVSFIYILLFFNIIPRSLKEIWIFLAAIILIITVNIKFKYYTNTIIFNISANELEVIGRKRTLKYKREEIDKIQIIKTDMQHKTIIFKKNNKKYNIKILDTPYLIKNLNISLTKLFDGV